MKKPKMGKHMPPKGDKGSPMKPRESGKDMKKPKGRT